MTNQLSRSVPIREGSAYDQVKADFEKKALPRITIVSNFTDVIERLGVFGRDVSESDVVL